MKICMIVPNPKVRGGIASVVNGYRDSELEKRYEVTYVESYRDGSKGEKLIKALFGYLQFFVQLVRNCPDLIHIHSSFGPSFYRKIPFIYLGCLFGIPVVNHIHGAEFDNFYNNASKRKKRLIKKVYNKCSRLIVLSDEWKALIGRIVPMQKIDVLENYCILPKMFPRQEKKKGQILFLGEIGERKGCFLMPDILEQIKRSCPDARLVMAGGGQITQAKKAFAEKGLSDSVIFPGWVEREKKQKLLKESEAFLFPTYYEGMPMAVLEAMSYGMGIVTTNVGGIPRLIIPGQTGYLEAPGDIEKMAEDAVHLLQDEALCRKLGEQARERAAQCYSLEVHLNHLEKIYKKACRE